MFTGIITSIGEIKEIEKNKTGYLISVKCDKDFLVDIEKGQSISVNGICFTLINNVKDAFVVEAMKETIRVTTIKNWDNQKVNLEKAMKLSDRLNGHIVQGHIDGIAEILKIEQTSDTHIYKFKIEKSIISFVVKKGSISIDGVSLTIVDVDKENFSVAIISHTFQNTIFKYYKIGDKVNIETDIIAKYIRQ